MSVHGQWDDLPTFDPQDAFPADEEAEEEPDIVVCAGLSIAPAVL